MVLNNGREKGHETLEVACFLMYIKHTMTRNMQLGFCKSQSLSVILHNQNENYFSVANVAVQKTSLVITS